MMKEGDYIEKMINGISPSTTGKFGTGFLTTHLLSRIVEISGIYINESADELQYQQFTLRLDRTPRDKAQMIKHYQDVYEQLQSFDDIGKCPIVQDYVPGEKLDTSFKYLLDDKGRIAAY